MHSRWFIAGGILLITLASCNGPAMKENTADTTVIDTAAKSTLPTATAPAYDPDTTDTIRGDQYTMYTTSANTAGIIRQVLQQELKDDIDKNIIDSFSRKFIFFEYDLNDDGKNEIFVGFRGPYFCGSGGCTQYLLDYQGKIITRFTVSGYPIVIDTNKTNGYKDLFIHSGRKDRIVKFDGRKYPSNPSLLPALKVLPGDGLPRALNFIVEPYPWFSF